MAVKVPAKSRGSATSASMCTCSRAVHSTLHAWLCLQAPRPTYPPTHHLLKHPPGEKTAHTTSEGLRRVQPGGQGWLAGDGADSEAGGMTRRARNALAGGEGGLTEGAGRAAVHGGGNERVRSAKEVLPKHGAPAAHTRKARLLPASRKAPSQLPHHSPQLALAGCHCRGAAAAVLSGGQAGGRANRAGRARAVAWALGFERAT